jgi:Kef-type K+ transport system membrane component KefB
MLYGIILQVLAVLAFAVIIGEIFEQFGLPAVAGELLSGLILGPTILGYVVTNSQTEAISSISLFFIIFLIGFEMRTETVRKKLPKATVATLTSFIFPLIVASAASVYLFPFGLASDFVVALAIAVPSISIISVIVMQYDLLKEESGQIILASVALTDIIAFIILAAISQSIGNTLTTILYLIIFIVGFAIVDRVLNSKREGFQRFLARSSRITKREDISYAVLIVIGLFVAYFFQAIGISYIIGAFFAGLILHDELIGREAFGRVSRTFTRMNRAFFIPLFFGFAGVEANFAASDYPYAAALIAVVISSIVPAMLLTYYSSKTILKLKESGGARNIAVILGGRGAVGIVIVTVALGSGMIDDTAYSLVIVGTLFVSIFVPLLLTRRTKGKASANDKLDQIESG